MRNANSFLRGLAIQHLYQPKGRQDLKSMLGVVAACTLAWAGAAQAQITIHVPNAGPGLCSQTGWLSPLLAEDMGELYKSYGEYVSKVERRLQELMDEGWFPKEYAADYVRGDLKLYPK